MEWSSDAEMIRPLENSRQVATERLPWAGNVKCLGTGLLIHLVRVRYLDLNRTLYGLARDRPLGCGEPAPRRWRTSASAKARSEPPPNHNFSLFSRSCQRTGLESIITRHNLETREARTMQLKGRKLRTWEASPGDRRVSKSRAGTGVRTDFFASSSFGAGTISRFSGERGVLAGNSGGACRSHGGGAVGSISTLRTRRAVSCAGLLQRLFVGALVALLGLDDETAGVCPPFRLNTIRMFPNIYRHSQLVQ